MDRTPQEQRRIRLEHDYQEMCNIRGEVVQWQPLIGQPPFVEKYDLTIRLRTIIGRGPQYRQEHRLTLTLPGGYPLNSAPELKMETTPPPFHPNWYEGGKWCGGNWIFSEGLGHFVVRMMQTLQFNSQITNEGSPANESANEWYIANRGNSGLFPCDVSVLPDPTTRAGKMFHVKERPKRSFRIVGS